MGGATKRIVIVDHYGPSAYVTAMAKLDIITLPDPLLRRTSEPIETVDDELRRLMDDMLETMYAAPGVGLAAVQVGVPRRLIVVDIGGKDDEDDAEEGGEGNVEQMRDPICLVNPEIVTLGTQLRNYEEGCLSLPDVLVEIDRPKTLTLRYIDRDGRRRELAADGMLATVLQHEIDHLDGKLIIDFLSRLKRDIIIRKFKKHGALTA